MPKLTRSITSEVLKNEKWLIKKIYSFHLEFLPSAMAASYSPHQTNLEYILGMGCDAIEFTIHHFNW